MTKLLLINPWIQDEEGVQWSPAYQKERAGLEKPDRDISDKAALN